MTIWLSALSILYQKKKELKMIYSNILKSKYRNLLRGFVIVLIAIFTLSLYSCQTSYVETYTPEQLRADTLNDGAKVIDVKIKSDSTINLTDYDAKYYKKFNESKDVIVWNKPDTVIVKSEPKIQNKLRNNFSKMSLQDILNANVEKEKINPHLTVLAIALTVAAILVIFSTASKSVNMGHF
jgi:hypothetical protein